MPIKGFTNNMYGTPSGPNMSVLVAQPNGVLDTFSNPYNSKLHNKLQLKHPKIYQQCPYNIHKERSFRHKCRESYHNFAYLDGFSYLHTDPISTHDMMLYM